MPAPDVCVIGGGIIGLSVADALLSRGARVTVLERRACGDGASGAAAGMLAPLAEAAHHNASEGPQPSSFLSLLLAGLDAHGAWLARLHEETGLDGGPHGPGMLRVADEGEGDALRSAYGWQRDLGLPLEWITAAELQSLEPSLRTCEVALRSPREQHVQPPIVVQELARVVTAHGGVIREGERVRGFVTRGRRVIAVRTETEELPCGDIVIAGGAWSAEIAAELHEPVQVRPVRGQILALRPEPPPFFHTIYTSRGYLVPKPDGRLVVGATEDEAGFDARPTAAGVARLLAMASQLSPALADAPFAGAWAGLRPVTPDRHPLLGPLPGWENVALATGHHRNGVLLAPLTGALLAEWVIDRRVPSAMSPFLPR